MWRVVSLAMLACLSSRPALGVGLERSSPGDDVAPAPASSWLAAAHRVAWPVVPAQSASGPGAGPVQAVPAAALSSEATVFRIFLNDGTTLVSYGEPARVGTRVVFSMPTSDAADGRLHLVDIAADHVDWPRTDLYAESARAARYLATRAEGDYLNLTTKLAATLNSVTLQTGALQRLAIVERARKTLADWPAMHFNYKRSDVQQLTSMLDETIAELRAGSGAGSFDLAFVAERPDAVREFAPLMAPPALDELVEQLVRAARLSDSIEDRISLLTVAINEFDRFQDRLSAAAAAWRSEAQGLLNAEVSVNRLYDEMTRRYLGRATARAREADVRGVERLVDDIRKEDDAFGHKRPEVMASLLSAVDEQLGAARRLRLQRDRWLLRQRDYRRYRVMIGAPLTMLDGVATALEDIKSLSGSGPRSLSFVERTAARIEKMVAVIAPPAELQSAHALFVSAVNLTGNAARIRRQATLAADVPRAWDAASAAAGALMLAARFRSEIDAALKLPQLPR